MNITKYDAELYMNMVSYLVDNDPDYSLSIEDCNFIRIISEAFPELELMCELYITGEQNKRQISSDSIDIL